MEQEESYDSGKKSAESVQVCAGEGSGLQNMRHYMHAETKVVVIPPEDPVQGGNPPSNLLRKKEELRKLSRQSLLEEEEKYSYRKRLSTKNLSSLEGGGILQRFDSFRDGTEGQNVETVQAEN